VTIAAPAELVLSTGPAANGGSCVARHDGRVVFVRYALPGERVRVRLTAQKGSYWHADAVEVLEASPDRIDPLCPVAGVDGAGCCDLAFVEPGAARLLKAEVVANQLARLGDYTWAGVAEPVGSGDPCGWRTRVRLGVGPDGRPGLHRYHSNDLVTDLRCGQLPEGMLAGLDVARWRGCEQIHVAIDDDDTRLVGTTARGRRGVKVTEGPGECVQRVGRWVWTLPLNAFWQSHRDSPELYSALVRDAAQGCEGARAWDLFGGAGLFAAALADAVGERGEVSTVDTSRAASSAATAALADVPGLQVISQSVRQFLTAQSVGADIAVLDPPRAGAGREVITALAGAGVSRVVHFGCEVAAFARDVGLYREHGYRVETIRVFDAFPLTHHVECVVVLTR
jgi:tRNA/tmRNA/rRNA uracil-C5-methylase (TrmA/RlmC/RlmD family)